MRHLPHVSESNAGSNSKRHNLVPAYNRNMLRGPTLLWPNNNSTLVEMCLWPGTSCAKQITRSLHLILQQLHENDAIITIFDSFQMWKQRLGHMPKFTQLITSRAWMRCWWFGPRASVPCPCSLVWPGSEPGLVSSQGLISSSSTCSLLWQQGPMSLQSSR